jgi:hypothetical protein
MLPHEPPPRRFHYRYLPRPIANQIKIRWVLLGVLFLALLIGVTVASLIVLTVNQAKAKDRNDPSNSTCTFSFTLSVSVY